MKNVLYIITRPSLEDISSVISATDSLDINVRVLLTQDGVQCSSLGSYLCVALQEDLLKRNLDPFCPTVGYMEMVNLIFDSDLVITI